MTDLGKIVDVYFNLNNGFWSVKHKGKLLGHAEFVLLEPHKFHVGEAGRKRVLKEGRKNVHAWIKGELLSYDKRLPRFGGREIIYRPTDFAINQNGFFYDAQSGLEIFPDDFNLIYFDHIKRKVYAK